MPGLYLGALLVSLAGLAHIDNRARLVFYAKGTSRFKFEFGSLRITILAVAVFLIWDGLGIANGIFFEGDGNLLLGVDLAKELPLEEPVFLFLLVYCGQLAMAGFERLRELGKFGGDCR